MTDQPPLIHRPLDVAASALAMEVAVPAAPGHWDELRRQAHISDDLTDHWKTFFDHLGTEGFADLSRRHQGMLRQIRDNGVTYNVYADQDSQQRPWALDLFPLIVPAADWAQIEAGVLQRTALLNRVMADIYGPQQLLHDGLLPPALVHGNPGYLRAMQGVEPAGGTWLHIAAFDLAHGPDGRWWVVAHRTQAPSGLGYLLENRLAITRQFPIAFSEMRVQRLAASYKALMKGLHALSPRGRDARIALLTPGPYNETYFEHAYLARYLGLHLVEGNDLTVRDRRVYLKTLHGLEPVDVLIKRLDDQWLDPLELRSDSALGVPGLMQAVRAGNVLLANAPGSAVLESSALHGFLPAISERLLGEPLRMPSLATWWCGEAASLQRALPVLKKSVVRSTYARRHIDTVIGPRLATGGLDQLTGRIVRQPDEYTVQAYLPLSQQPTWRNGDIAPRAAMLRVFALADGAGSWRVLPGGMVRLAPAGQLIASMQRGGSSADCWVLTNGHVDTTSLLRGGTPATPDSGQQKRLVTSRTAENLFWLGRYTERAENTVRLAQIILRTLQGEEHNAGTLLEWFDACAKDCGLTLRNAPGAAQSQRVFERSLVAMLGADSGATSVGYNLRALRHAADQVRERLSQEQRALINRLDDEFAAQHATLSADAEYAPQEALEALEEASELLSAVTGAQTDRMVRDDGWRMLSIGRHIERLQTLSSALQLALRCGSLEGDTGFETLLALFDSTITFHAQYQQRRDLVALLDVLVVNRDNPRSLAWVLSTLRSRLFKLPPDSDGNTLDAQLPNPADWVPEVLDTEALLQLLSDLENAALTLSDRIAQRYFSHADNVSLSLVS